MTLIGIDPGDTHVGMAIYSEIINGMVTAWEATPGECIVWIEQNLKAEDTLIVEEFRLYPDKAGAQGYSQMKTPELIGVLRYLCAKIGAQWVQQGAGIKKATLAILKAKGVVSLAVKNKAGNHAKDAELHLWYHIMRQEELNERSEI